ncbi:rhodanese-like domain-containing protein [Atopobacter phocae]|uniref:rhodanese-like domain-containing protein n=1 Tax=Atopobacter phocae TaxID=136492 RepID=UPI000472F3FA|nr:rhodanese-like domain-containing protein [Atopobacter phocae]
MYYSISIDEFYQQANKKDIHIIDVREEDEYNHGHIPTATNLPLSLLSERFNVLNKQQHYFIICRSGARSSQATQFLVQHGYHVTNVLGGMSFWKGEIEYV